MLFFGVFEKKNKFLLTFLGQGPLEKGTKHSKSRTKKYSLCLKAKSAAKWPNDHITSPFLNLWKPHKPQMKYIIISDQNFSKNSSSTLFLNQFYSENTHGKLSLSGSSKLPPQILAGLKAKTFLFKRPQISIGPLPRFFRPSYGPAFTVYKPTSGMTKIASESPATKTEEPCIDILFTGKDCFAIIGFVSTLFFTSSEFSHIFCTELVLK